MRGERVIKNDEDLIVVEKTDYEQHILKNTVPVTHNHHQTWLLDIAKPNTYMWEQLYTCPTILATRDLTRYLRVRNMDICLLQPDISASKKFFNK